MSSPSIRITGHACSSRAAAGLEDQFPGRWDRRRSLPPEVAPLVDAVANATTAAGWWTPGSGAAVAGGLVVGVDRHAFAPTLRFAAHLQRPQPNTGRPSDFLLALPSSAAAIVGMALGLDEHQATVTMHGLSGFQAVAHAADLLRAGQLQRVVAAALTVHEEDAATPWALAIAWCLEAAETAAMPAAPPPLSLPTTTFPVRLESWAVAATATGDATAMLPAVHGVPPAVRHLAAPSLLGATTFLDRAVPGERATFAHRDPDLGGRAELVLAAEPR